MELGVLTEKFDLRTIADFYGQVQKLRIIIENRLRAMVQEKDEEKAVKFYQAQFDRLQDIEKDTAKMLKVVEEHPVWPWLKEVKGISNILAGKLLSLLDIEKAPHISSFWKFCGLGVTNGERDKPTKGEKLSYCKRAKTIMYLIGSSFLKCNSPFRRIYDEGRKHYEQKEGWSDLRKHFAAMRKMEKIFLSCLYIYWAEAALKETPKPYIENEGHTIYRPEEFV